MDTHKINAALQPLVDVCTAAPDPLGCLRQQLDLLRTTGNWLEMELRQLQILTTTAIKGMPKGP